MSMRYCYYRLHIPIRDRKAFDDIIQRSVGQSYSQDRLNQSSLAVLSDYPHQIPGAGQSSMNIQASASPSQSR